MSSNILDQTAEDLADAVKVDVQPRFLAAPLIPYEEAASTTHFSDIPRFGHSSNFSDLFYQDAPEKQGDYLEGLFFVGALTFAFFALWALLLIVLKLWSYCCCCCRCGNVGFLSGRPFTLATDEHELLSKEDVNKFSRRTSRSRIVFLLSGSILILFSILLISKGFKNIEDTRSTADSSLDDIRRLIDESTVLTEDLRDVGGDAIELRDQLLVELSKDRLCPNNPAYLIEDEIGKQINNNAGLALDMLTLLGDFTRQDLKTLEDGLTNADAGVDDVDVMLESAANKQWIGIIFALPLVFLAAILMAGAMAAQGHIMTDCVELGLSWFILPWFAVWIVVAFVACSVLALAATANADICAGGVDGTPDSTILTSLRNGGHPETDTIFEVTRYYVTQCTAEAKVDPFLFMREHAAEIEKARGIVNQLADSLSGLNVNDLSLQCGRDFEPLRSSLDAMLDILKNLEKSANSGLSILSCERIVPIYADIVYDGMCDTSVTGLAWIFASLLIISTTGMIMLTLRSAFKNNVVMDDKDNTDEDSEANAMRKLEKKNGKNNSNHELYLHEHPQWDSGMRQRTSSDTESVYTNRNGELDFNMGQQSVYTNENGELTVTELDPRELPPNARPSYYYRDDDYAMDDDYANIRPPRPSAPHENHLYY